MTDDEIRKYWEDLLWNSEEGNLRDDEWYEFVGELSAAIRARRDELVESLKRTPEAGNRASINERLTEYRSMSDELNEAIRRRDERRQRSRDREASRNLAQATVDLASAGNAQAKALTDWTRWLAIATAVLAVATVVLVVVTAAG